MSVTPILRVLLAAALAVVAFAHLDVADTYVEVGTKPFSLGYQFYAQAAGALLLALAVLVPFVRSWGRLDPLVWASAAGFGVISLVPLVVSRYRTIPVPGLDGGFMETWEAPRAVLSAVSESAVIVLAGAGLLLALRARSARTPVEP